MLNPNLFTVTHEGERWVCRPSVAFVFTHVIAGVCVTAFMLYLANGFLRNGNQAETTWIGIALLLVSGFMIGLTVWAWRSRHTPLTAERSGRVCYGRRELCPAGALRAIRIQPVRGGDGNWDLSLELNDGKLVGLPGRFFASLGDDENTRAFALELASALGVKVEDFAVRGK